MYEETQFDISPSPCLAIHEGVSACSTWTEYDLFDVVIDDELVTDQVIINLDRH